MATLNIDLYDALKEAKVSEEKARAAAVAFSETSRVVSEQADIKSDVKQLKIDVQDIKVRMTLLQWMVAFNLAATMAVLWKLIK
jgi:hypothetical protein